MLRARAKRKSAEIDGEVMVHDVDHSLADRMSLRKKAKNRHERAC
jgi:hypothetical protein